jgi:predicted DNA repair protein MutK
MFLVGGGILSHSLHSVNDNFSQLNHFIAQLLPDMSWLVTLSTTVFPLIFNGLLGVIAGGLLFLIVPQMTRLFQQLKK